MLRRVSTLLALTFLVTLGFAKDKTKNTLPAYVLQAKTVAIIIDPNAGMSIDDPQANERAQKDVEAALLKWGRFDLVSETKSADLIIVVRKGNGRPMDDAMSDARQNNGGDAINSSGRGGSMGPPRGSLPPSTADTQSPGASRAGRGFLCCFQRRPESPRCESCVEVYGHGRPQPADGPRSSGVQEGSFGRREGRSRETLATNAQSTDALCALMGYRSISRHT